MSFHIRRATLDDVDACARVCLLTGRYGADGTGDFPNDPVALSRIFTTPYLRLEPQLSLVLVDEDAGGVVVGYCLAALDTASFFARYEAEVRPHLLAQVPPAARASPSPREASIHALYAAPDYALPAGILARHPAHVHIDLLPAARGKGHGRALMRLQQAQLARRGAPGVFLNMAASNTGARAFYEALGFSEFARGGGEGEDATLFFSAPLAPPPPVGGNPYPGLQTNVARYVEGAGAALAIGDEVLGPRWVAVTMPEPWRAARDRLGGAPPLAVVMVESVQVAVLEAALAGLPVGVEVVVGIGGGMAVDTAKYFAWRTGLRLVTIPTALTVDAFVTPPAGVRKGEDHTVEYVGSATPDPLVVDFDLIRTAPVWLNVAGVGDILSCHTACYDWELAHQKGRSAECPFSAADVAAARRVLADTLAAAHDIAVASDAGLRALVHGYMQINALCLPAGHPRCEEGSEHFVLYVLETRLKRGFIHGHIVGLGLHLMARLQSNDAGRITAAMRDMGLRFDPEVMGLTRADVRDAVLALKDFVAGRPDLFYTVINEAVIDEEWVDAALEGLAFAP
jgi:glycerol dehydrogenase-like iron-containing ADH family enzyme/ribosomal protein S18 acetylase RimI-like enzyme